MENKNEDTEKISFESALDKTGFGIYSYINTFLSGLAMVSMASLTYGTTIIVPASTCELETTTGQRGILVAAPITGLIIGSPLWGYLGDTRGRRNMLLVSLLSSAVVNAVSALSVNWIMLMILQFIAAVLAAAKYPLSMTHLSESVPTAKRNLVVLLVSSIFMLSQGLIAVIAIPVIPLTFSNYLSALNIYWNSWRTLVVVYSLPSLICACCYFFMYDSPKYTHMKGDEQKALEILRSIHRLNNRNGEVFDVKGLLPDIAQQDSGLTAKDQIVPLFKPPILKYTIIMTALLMLVQLTVAFAVWLPTIANTVLRMYETGEVTALNLCGILNADIEMPVDPDETPCALNPTSLLIVFLVGVLQASLSTFLTIFIVNRAGRRNTAIAVVSVVGLCGILVNLVPNPIGTTVLFGLFLMGVIVMGLYAAMTVALFPPHLRAMALALTMTVGLISSFCAIQIVNVLLFTSCELGTYLFAGLYLSSAVIAAFLPDDRHLQKLAPPEDKP